MDFRKKIHKQNTGRNMTPEEEASERKLFHNMDVDNNGEINYWEFLEYNGFKILQQHRRPVSRFSTFSENI